MKITLIALLALLVVPLSAKADDYYYPSAIGHDEESQREIILKDLAGAQQENNRVAKEQLEETKRHNWEVESDSRPRRDSFDYDVKTDWHEKH